MHEQRTQEAPLFTRPPQQHPPAPPGWPQPAQNQPPAGAAGQQYGAAAGAYTPPTYPGSPPTLPPKPSRRSGLNDRRWWAAGGAVVLFAAAGVAYTMNRGGTDAATASPTSTTVAQVPAAPVTTMQTEPSPQAAPPPPASAPPAPAPIVAVDALPGLLLSPDQISQRLNTPGMGSSAVLSDPLNVGTVTPPNCVTTFAPVAAAAYNGSGYTGLAVQQVALEPSVKAHQGVIAYPDPGAAKSLFDKLSADWSACKSSHVVFTGSDGEISEVDVGVPAMSGDVMTLDITSTNSKTPNQRCERAITVRGNVIVDVRACAPNINSAAYDFATDIAAKIQ